MLDVQHTHAQVAALKAKEAAEAALRAAQQEKDDEDDELDPLDAFMAGEVRLREGAGGGLGGSAACY